SYNGAFFFFSSRRRHTRFSRDWSSDVCSSDLAQACRPTGKAYGLDMTGDMLALARENQKKAGVTNVEFLKGEIEAIPLPANSVRSEERRVGKEGKSRWSQ